MLSLTWLCLCTSNCLIWHFPKSSLKTALALVPDAMSIGLDIVDMSETSKGSLEAKSEFGRNPMGVCLSLIQVYISQDPLPQHVSSLIGPDHSYHWQVLLLSLVPLVLFICSVSNMPPTVRMTWPLLNQQLFIVLLHHSLLMILTNLSCLCYYIPTLHHCPYLHSFRLLQWFQAIIP